MLKKLLKKDEGFTLIEVVIVLAIAALIILVILQAITAAQRAQRDSTRKQKASQVSSYITEYESNCNGFSPQNLALGTVGSCGATNGTGTMKIGDYDATNNSYWTVVTSSSTTCATLPSNNKTFELVYNQISNAHDFQLWTCLEAGGQSQIH